MVKPHSSLFSMRRPRLRASSLTLDPKVTYWAACFGVRRHSRWKEDLTKRHGGRQSCAFQGLVGAKFIRNLCITRNLISVGSLTFLISIVKYFSLYFKVCNIVGAL